MTIANEKKSKKNKFYQFYKYLFNTYESNLEKFPVFYNSQQIKFLLFSLYGKGVIQTKTMIEEEFSVLQRNYVSKKGEIRLCKRKDNENYGIKLI